MPVFSDHKPSPAFDRVKTSLGSSERRLGSSWNLAQVPEMVSPEHFKTINFIWITPDSAQTNPLQWRTHGEIQLAALKDLIFGEDGKGGGEDFVGWAKPVVINDRTVENGWEPEEAVPTVVDGHGRLEVALKIPGSQVPAGIGSWTPRQEKILLRFLDPLAALAGIDFERAKELDSQIETSGDALSELSESFARNVEALAELAEFGEFPDLPPVDESKANEEAHYLIKVEVIDSDQFEVIGEAIQELIETEGFDAVIKL
jgi:hypothetical protein